MASIQYKIWNRKSLLWLVPYSSSQHWIIVVHFKKHFDSNFLQTIWVVFPSIQGHLQLQNEYCTRAKSAKAPQTFYASSLFHDGCGQSYFCLPRRILARLPMKWMLLTIALSNTFFCCSKWSMLLVSMSKESLLSNWIDY